MVFQILLQRFPTAHERQMALKFLVAENKAQDVVEKDTKKIAEAAAKLASQKLAAAQNSNDARRAIVNEGDIVQRATFSPWEALVQCLLFTNESAYVY
jgi:ABC-type xylose transport system substrate-binding protein